MDTIQIEILEDGTIKITTDPVSAANHQTAEQFLKDIATLAGGPSTRARRTDRAHHHHHHHAHDHAHDHSHE